MLLLPQRYIFSSKSQLLSHIPRYGISCCCYHKGTYFQANHNCACVSMLSNVLLLLPQRYIFSSKSQRMLKTTKHWKSCCCYHKGTYFQANHNIPVRLSAALFVVVATTKVHIFKQITTNVEDTENITKLLLLPQRYIFSSKSQLLYLLITSMVSCCCYHKGTYFQANHNQVKARVR